MDATQAQAAAEALYEDYEQIHPFRPLPEELAPQTIDDAYRIQDHFLARRAQSGGAFGGYKLAYTTATMQQRSGLTEPALGRIFADTIYPTPATAPAADYVRVGLECEIAVRLSADLPASGAPYTRESVANAVGAVMAAVEIIDVRAPEGMTDGDRALLGVAANIWNAGIVLGPEIIDWQSLDLECVHGSVHVNRNLMGEGYGRDVMGHPIEPLAWLANALAERGESLHAGAVVITGSIVAPQFLTDGDEAVVSIDELGDAVLLIT